MKIKNLILFLFFIFTGFIYISNTWSPSSYAHALKNHFGYEDIKPDFGVPRPVRSDEWAVVTPLTQALVRNNFERYNKTSLYEEDLRINYGLPIADWGIIFKPTMWLFGKVNPAYAYSFHWFAIFSLFIFGYAFLFKKFGASQKVAILLSFGIYFTGFSQFWWNEKGPLFAIFPWVIIPFLLNIKNIWKIIFFYYASVAWLLTNLYPPIQISLSFVGVLILLVHQKDIFKFPTILWVAIAAALAAGTAGLYLQDYLIGTSATLYPGERRSMGGGVSFEFIMSWFFPGINFIWKYRDLMNLNMSEIGVVGAYYYLATLFFLNYKNFSEIFNDEFKRRTFLILAGGFLLQLAWMIFPIPSKIGMIFLWDHVQPARMQFASGVTLTLITFYVANTVGVIFTLRRFLLLSISIFLAWWFFKQPFGLKRIEDLVFLPIFLVVYFSAKNKKEFFHEVIIISSLIFSVLLFGRFNPLQSAWPIFNIENNKNIEYLKEIEKDNNGMLVVASLPGAIANGMGFRSLSHVTPVPHLDFWEKYFPEISSDTRNGVFNRYSHIIPKLIPQPGLLQADAVEVPLGRFAKTKQVIEIFEYSENLSPYGNFVAENKYPEVLVLNGWAGWHSTVDFHEMEIMLDVLPAEKIEMISNFRPDLPINTNQKISAVNGFIIMIPLKDGKRPGCISLISFDKLTSERSILNNPPDIPLCPPNAVE